MDPLYIQYLLRKSGKTQRDMAQRLGLTEGHVCKVLFGLRKSRPVQLAFARAIGRPVAEVFPDNIPLKTAA